MAIEEKFPVSNHPTFEAPDGLLTPQEIAVALRVKLSWVYGESRKNGPGTIPKIRVGKYVRFRLADVLQWLNER